MAAYPFFVYFPMFPKLQEMQIIGNGLFFHIMDYIVYEERGIGSFTAKTQK